MQARDWRDDAGYEMDYARHMDDKARSISRN
jgi:hypothetical protein